MLYRFDDCEFVPSARRLTVGGEAQQLGGRAFDLLLALVEGHDRVMSKEELIERVWPDLAVEPNNLQVQVWALRKVLGGHTIATVARRGYRFMPAVERVPAGRAVGVPAPASLRAQAVQGRPEDAMAARLVRHLDTHRLVTLVSPDADAGDAVIQVAAQWMASHFSGGVWQTEADALTGMRAGGETDLKTASPRLRALLQRLNQRAAVLVVLNAHRAEGVHLTVQHLLAEWPGLRLAVSLRQALKLKGEKVVVGDAQARPPESLPRGLSSSLTGTGHMRWHPRP